MDQQVANLEASSVTSPAEIFQGYNSVIGSGLSTAVNGKFNISGATSNVKCSVSISASELARSLEIDQSLSVSYGPIASGNEKMSFYASLEVTTYSISVTVFSRHGGGTKTMTDVNLKEGITVPKSDEELDNFVRFYGDSFLSSVTEGGEYYAVYTFYSQTREEQEKLKTSMNASGIFEGANVDISLQASMDKFLKTTEVRYSFSQEVSGLRNPQLPAPSAFIEYATAFPSIQLDAPVLIGMGITGYEHVPNIGSAFDKVAKNRIYFTGDTINGGLTSKLVTISNIYNQMKWLHSTYDTYGDYNDDTLNTNTVTAKTDIKAIKTQMTDYDLNATKQFTVLTLNSINNGTPVLEYSVSTSPAWGGGGGGPFDDVTITSYIQNHTRITSLALSTSRMVVQISTTYQNDLRSWIDTHGGNDGSQVAPLQLLPNQFITRVYGRSGALVDHINLVITDGRSIGGGGSGGGAYDWSVPTGSFVLGFRGRSGSMLDQIQVTYAQFKPAQWKAVTED